MYSPKLKESQIKELCRLRETFKRNGKRLTMTQMVQEAVDEYIEKLKDQENYDRRK